GGDISGHPARSPTLVKYGPGTLLSTPRTTCPRMLLSRRTLGLLPFLWLAACAAADSPPPSAMAPALPEEPLAEAPPPEPEPSLEERWAAPFAVTSRGRTPPRETRAVFVWQGA